jgi:hypothetical protein
LPSFPAIVSELWLPDIASLPLVPFIEAIKKPTIHFKVGFGIREISLIKREAIRLD